MHHDRFPLGPQPLPFKGAIDCEVLGEELKQEFYIRLHLQLANEYKSTGVVANEAARDLLIAFPKQRAKVAEVDRVSPNRMVKRDLGIG